MAGDFDRVLEADTGATGIDIAAAEHPALIVLDLGLPDTTRAEVCAEIGKWSDAPILVLSARHSDHEKVDLLAYWGQYAHTAPELVVWAAGAGRGRAESPP